MMTGSPWYTYNHGYMTNDDLWERLSMHDQNNDIMTAGSRSGSDTHADDAGIVLGHAYTVIGVKTIDGEKLVKMRNPWGSEKYVGLRSDSDSWWTSSRRA